MLAYAGTLYAITFSLNLSELGYLYHCTRQDENMSSTAFNKLKCDKKIGINCLASILSFLMKIQQTCHFAKYN